MPNTIVQFHFTGNAQEWAILAADFISGQQGSIFHQTPPLYNLDDFLFMNFFLDKTLKVTKKLYYIYGVVPPISPILFQKFCFPQTIFKNSRIASLPYMKAT